MTKYFRKKVTEGGGYIGAFDGAKPPTGSVEIASPPDHGKMAWQNGKWVDQRATAEVLNERMKPTESPARLARKLEDILDLLVNGTPLPKGATDWLVDRKNRRAP